MYPPKYDIICVYYIKEGYNTETRRDNGTYPSAKECTYSNVPLEYPADSEEDII